ncbi:histone-fold-containing protein, partial [Paraphysoderma sedebokerense]
SIEDFQLPKAILTRIAKNVLPDNTNLQKEAKTALGNAATIFINYLTATATEVMKVSKHKTIQASDVFEALKLIEMQDHIPRLQELLEG